MTAPQPQDPLKIGELAGATGASIRSIRHYDEHGLLASARAENGYRVFQAVAITQVRQIQRLIATGFSLEEIRSFPDCMRLIEGAKACQETSEAQRKRLAILERQIVDLERRRARLRSMLTEVRDTTVSTETSPPADASESPRTPKRSRRRKTAVA